MTRRLPYTARGIKRLKCFRCPNRAVHQWQICADGNLYRPLCLDCDVALNKLVLEFMGFANAVEMIQVYKAKAAR